MMGKIRLILNVLCFTVMTMNSAFALEGAGGNFSQSMIERHDRDGDNRVSMEEFPGPDDHFIRMDLDGDSFINQEEARQAPRPDGQEGRVPGKFTEDDGDGDGVVSRTEFSGPADHFDRLDLNGDGAIQESEARQSPPGMTRSNQRNR